MPVSLSTTIVSGQTTDLEHLANDLRDFSTTTESLAGFESFLFLLGSSFEISLQK
jgi:hypothetical protein